jgi:hypothetical protein
MAEDTKPPVLAAEAAVQLGEFARNCKAAARAVSLYPGQHPAIVSSLDRLADATARLTAAGAVHLQVTQDSLLMNNAAPAKAEQAVVELSDLLQRHRIGALTVNAGADAGSWRALLLLLARAPEEVRADGGIAQLWATAGGPSLEVREINYAEVLRERRGSGAAIDEIIAAALHGPVLDDEDLEALLAILHDAERVEELRARLDHLAQNHGNDARTAAVLHLLQSLAKRAGTLETERLECALDSVGRIASNLPA